MAVLKVLYASLFITISQFLTVFSNPCGNKAKADPRDRGAPGWQLCYIKLPEDEAYASTRCSDLVSDIQPPGTDDIYPTSQTLLDAGGSFGCWYDTEGLDSDIQNACSDNRGHHVSLANQPGSNILGLCIRYPSELTDPVWTTTANGLDHSCGSIARPDPEARSPPGWYMCYIKLPEDQAHINTRCDELINNIKPPSTDTVYESKEDLLEAGGQFGCWYDKNGLSGSLEKACKASRGHHVTLSSYEGTNILGLCIQPPVTAASTTITAPGSTKDPGATWRIVGAVLAVLLLLTLVALFILVYRHRSRKKPEPPQVMGLVNLLSVRSHPEENSRCYTEETPIRGDIPPRCLLRLPSLPGEEKIYEEIPECIATDDYEVPVPSPRNAMPVCHNVYMEMGGANAMPANERHSKQYVNHKVPPGASPGEPPGNTKDR